MFLRVKHSGYRGTEQIASGLYMALFEGDLGDLYPNGKAKLYAAASKVSMNQCGNFMMGLFRFGNQWITVSGPCGSDGLPLFVGKVPEKYRDKLVPLPEALATAYWTDETGHNDAGDTTRPLRKWGIETFVRGGTQ
jgi:hypothetical protein